MTRVLVVDRDATLTSGVARGLWEAGIEVVEHARAAGAREALAGSAFDAVLVDWAFREVVEDVGSAPVIVMVSYPDPGQERELARRFTLLRKPFTSVELLLLLNEQLGRHRNLSRRLLDALRASHAQRESVRIVLGPEGRPGAEVLMVDGEIHDAHYGALQGEPALCALLAEPRGVRLAVARPPFSRTVHRPFRALLLDLLEQLEEAERPGTTPEREG